MKSYFRISNTTMRRLEMSKRSSHMSDLVILDYEKLKKCISDIMPAEYLTGPIVEEQHYDRPFFDFELNFDPYKRRGQILPTEFRYYDKEDVVDQNGEPVNKGHYNFPKGYNWLAIYFWATERHNEKHLLPVAFIAVFMRHFIGSYIEGRYSDLHNTFNCYELMKLSDDELRANGYESPDYRCKRLLETRGRIHDMIIALCRSNTPITEELLSDAIVKCIRFMTDNYHIEYWSYPKDEYDRAEHVYQNAAYQMQEDLLRAAELKYGK